MDDHPYLYCSPAQLSPLLGKAATSSATYLYDDAGNRIGETTVTGSNSPVRTYFLVDTQTQTGYSQVIEQSTTVGTPTVSYVWGLNLIERNNATGTPNAGTYYFIVDGHGSTAALADANGNVVQTFHYDGFGNALGFTPSTAITQYLYAQQYYDLASNTYYDWARNYDPVTGLFDQADYGYSGSLADPMSGLPYVFTGGDPINLSDLTGHDFSIGGVLAAVSIDIGLDTIGLAVGVAEVKTAVREMFPATIVNAAQVPLFDKQLAELCRNVYSNAPSAYGGWMPVNMPWRGLTQADFSSGAFFAQLYSNGGAYVLAFRGTVATSIGDWYTNVAQGAFGTLLPTQYQEAVALAQRVSQAVGGAQLTMTGHSLGGGLAADAAVATGRPAVTFNAAGLNPETLVSEDGQFFGSSVINYSVEGELLTGIQNLTLAPEAFGQQFEIAPTAQDAGWSPLQLHGIAAVLNAFDMPSS